MMVDDIIYDYDNYLLACSAVWSGRRVYERFIGPCSSVVRAMVYELDIDGVEIRVLR